ETDGAISYEAELLDTPEGKTVQALIKPNKDGRQTLGSVSIRGYMVGEATTDPDGHVTPADVEIDGLDLTDTPGVLAASVTPGAAETADRQPIFESAEAFVDMTAETKY